MHHCLGDLVRLEELEGLEGNQTAQRSGSQLCDVTGVARGRHLHKAMEGRLINSSGISGQFQPNRSRLVVCVPATIGQFLQSEAKKKGSHLQSTNANLPPSPLTSCEAHALEPSSASNGSKASDTKVVD